MIKGVNRRIVEVRFPESVYFEKAVVFLRTDCPTAIDPVLAREAGMKIMELEKNTPEISLGEQNRLKLFMRLRAAGDLIFKTAVIICAAFVIANFMV